MAAEVQSDLERERRKATFNPLHLTYILDNGKERTERRRYVQNLVINDEDFKGPNYHFMGRSELYTEGMRKAALMVKKVREHGLSDMADLYWFRSTIFPNENPPSALHTGMFLQTLLGQANEEQKDRWFAKAKNFKILGTYAQTELGHGTFLRGLETTATYDRSTVEFILNSPTLTSTKWWPGGLGKTSNHAIVMANLFIDGKSHGMQSFMVQLRDMDTHQPLPGITLGDIGPKFGYGMIDNGFMRLDNVRIPRGNMLMKNAQVERDGTFVKSKHSKLGYGTMLFVRAMIVSDVAAKGLAQSVTIVTRYSAVRRQSEMVPGGPEPQILDYQTQQYKIFPLIATTYAFKFAGEYISNIYFRINSQIQRGDTDLLPELHGLSSGLKAYTTNVASVGMEACRLACGGHGYSQASGLPKIYVNAVPGCTYEGENTVLLLQTARYLVKMYTLARQGQKLSASTSYLCEPNTAPCRLDGKLELNALVDSFRHRTSRLVSRAAESVSQLVGQGKPQHEAWNLTSVQLVKAAEAHTQFFIVKNFADTIAAVKGPSEVKAVLTQLCQLYGAHGVINKSGDFLEDGFMTSNQLSAVTQGELNLLATLRPNAVALVDAFDYPDEVLQSVLGRYDGQVYENLYKWALESPLNKTQVHESYYKHMKALQQASKL